MNNELKGVVKMKSLFDYGNAYIKRSDWRDIAMLKFCLCAIGIIIGCKVSEKYKRPVVLGSFIVFILTYIPLMNKLFNVMVSENENCER